MSFRVFISHSTLPKDGLDQRLMDQVLAHSDFRKQLCERLRGEFGDHAVVIDETIPVGRNWRDFLFEHLAGCNAGVILVNEQALHHSDWVNTEVSVLGYRAHGEKDDFRLIVIPFGGVTKEEIAKKTAWQPVALSDLQMLPPHGLDETDPAAVEAVTQQVIDTLKDLAGLSHYKSASGWLVDRLCALLQLEARDLQDLANSLGVDIMGVNNLAVIQRRIALSIYRTGPTALHKLLSCPTCRIKSRDLEEVLEILSTYWIDMSASVGVLSCCRKSDSRRVVAINGKEACYTPEAYVRQICGQLNTWPVIPVEPRFGAESVIEQIRETLVERFRVGLHKLIPQFRYATSEEIIRALNTLIGMENSVFVFVTFLQVGGGDIDDMVNAIFKTFPNIRIVVCTGTEQGKASLRPEITMLTPELSLGVEERAFREYLGASTKF